MYRFFTAHDNLKIRFGRWPSEPPYTGRPLVLLNGRTEFMEKYRETIKDLVGRGYVVYSLDWRGQGLSGRMLDDPLKGYVASYEDYLTDLERLMKIVEAEMGEKASVLLCHSMGGHIGLRYLHDHPKSVERAALCSPMIDIRTFPFPKYAVRMMTRIVANTGRSSSYAPGARLSIPEATFKNNRLTSDLNRFEREKSLLKSNPELAVGGVTIGWLQATFDSIDRLKNDSFTAGIDTPVSIVAAGADRVVSLAAQKRICRRLPNCRMTVIPNAKHEILMESDDMRNRFWEIFDAFCSIEL